MAATTPPIGVGFTVALADLVPSTIRCGPKDSCSNGESLARQLSMRPT